MNFLGLIDIVPLVRQFVDLQERGSLGGLYYTGCCPFHDDQNPSFVVYPDGRCLCFACWPDGGSAVDFYAKIMGITCSEAYIKLMNDQTVAKSIGRAVIERIRRKSVSLKNVLLCIQVFKGLRMFRTAERYAKCSDNLIKAVSEGEHSRVATITSDLIKGEKIGL